MKKRNLKLRVLVVTAIAVSTILAPISGAIAEATTIKSKSNVNVRAAGNNAADKVAYVYAGEVANYLGTENGWYKIEINGQIGYSHSNYWKENTITAKSNVNVRAAANNSAGIVACAAAGKEAIVLGRNGSWLFIDFNGVKGYSFQSYWNIPDTVFLNLTYVNTSVTIPTPTPPPTPVPVPTPTPEPQAPIAAGDTYILSTSVSGHLTAADAQAGTNVMRTAEAGTYYVYKVYSGMLNVSKTKGEPGVWIKPCSTGVPPTPTPQPETPAISTIAEKVIKTATSLLGAPYVYGGEDWTEGGFDCSGLTQYSYRKAGINIPRTATQQWAGISNKVTVPLPGDIIVFSRSGDIYHVGIYIGDNKMIHAPQPGSFVEIKDLTWNYKNGLVHGFLRPTK